ncbi:hypothetical protein THOM_1390 [Trachipleistophora hominis]|uniref:Uncharacterized protein n=1 Tax=Trachipleistophora hominis TaxID=72359 RepID=L7JW79_TRAHO|nr:hypothetical protein THOM_1390 [Trachipleistophora hominis]
MERLHLDVKYDLIVVRKGYAYLKLNNLPPNYNFD